jgi:hypothetical protein
MIKIISVNKKASQITTHYYVYMGHGAHPIFSGWIEVSYSTYVELKKHGYIVKEKLLEN